MGLFNRLRLLKRAIQITFAINIFFVLMGVWACVHYANTLEPGFGFLMVVGFGTLIFGIAIPAMVLMKFTEELHTVKTKAQTHGAQILAHWINEKSKGTDTFKSPKFWTDLLLWAAQWSTQKSDSPLANVVRELAPAVRFELHRQPVKKGKTAKRATKKSKSKKAA